MTRRWMRRSERNRENYFRGQQATVTRPEVLPKVLAYYRGRFSQIPESVRVSFGNGVTAVYDLRVQQPAPVVWKCKRLR